MLQLTFDTFTVGRFLSFTSEGCPDGFMTIREDGRPATGGQWCGSAWGYTVYYSETPSINLTLYLLRLSEQVRNRVGFGEDTPSDSPQFRLGRYGIRAFILLWKFFYGRFSLEFSSPTLQAAFLFQEIYRGVTRVFLFFQN